MISRVMETWGGGNFPETRLLLFFYDKVAQIEVAALFFLKCDLTYRHWVLLQSLFILHLCQKECLFVSLLPSSLCGGNAMDRGSLGLLIPMRSPSRTHDRLHHGGLLHNSSSKPQIIYPCTSKQASLISLHGDASSESA